MNASADVRYSAPVLNVVVKPSKMYVVNNGKYSHSDEGLRNAYTIDVVLSKWLSSHARSQCKRECCRFRVRARADMLDIHAGSTVPTLRVI